MPQTCCGLDRTLRHRPEIDGLRAVAVVPVILFHANPAWLPAGFLGVDVFFVISGFLITSLLMQDLAEGTYSLARFYERRARRILPALMTMVAACMVMGWFVMLPRAFGTLARSAAATATFLSNVFFWQTTDYFDIDAIAQPLLHTWSLAVEEQFYILFPLLLALLWRRSTPSVMTSVVVALFLASLAFSQWGAHVNPKVNYFFTPSRFWELLLGALGAIVHRSRNLAPNPWIAGTGLLMILASMAMFPPSILNPSLWTLIPTGGALCVLVWGGPLGPVGRVLTWPAMIFVGKISYSLYLWHYPVFSFSAALGPVSEGTAALVAQIAVIGVLSTASWRYVETPFRRPRAAGGPAATLWVAAAVLGAVVVVGQGLGTHPRLTLRYLASSQSDRDMLLFSETYRPGDLGEAARYHCFFEKGGGFASLGPCVPPGHPSVVFWGDSHAESLSRGFMQGGTITGLFAGPGCGPFLDDGWTLSQDCAAQNRFVLTQLRRTPPDVLVLHAYWRTKRAFMRLLPDTLARLHQDLPHTRILVVGGMPFWLPSLPELIVAGHVVGQFDAQIPAQLSGVTAADDSLAAILAGDIAAGRVTFLRPTQLICHADLCPAYAGTMPYAQDYGHLTEAGALDMATRLKARAPDILGP